jgi:hypothetical protein
LEVVEGVGQRALRSMARWCCESEDDGAALIAAALTDDGVRGSEWTAEMPGVFAI